MVNYKDYWNTQFSKYNHIWGETHSKSAEIALSLFRKHKVIRFWFRVLDMVETVNCSRYLVLM